MRAKEGIESEIPAKNRVLYFSSDQFMQTARQCSEHVGTLEIIHPSTTENLLIQNQFKDSLYIFNFFFLTVKPLTFLPVLKRLLSVFLTLFFHWKTQKTDTPKEKKQDKTNKSF